MPPWPVTRALTVSRVGPIFAAGLIILSVSLSLGMRPAPPPVFFGVLAAATIVATLGSAAASFGGLAFARGRRLAFLPGAVTTTMILLLLSLDS